MTRLEAPACNCGRAADLRVSGGFLGTFDTCQQCLDRLRRDMFPTGRPPSFATVTTYHPQENVMTTDTDTLSDRLTPLAAEYADLAEKADQIKARQEEIKAAIRDLVPGPDSYDAGALSVVVSTNRRFDAKRALAMLPEALVPLVTYPETAIDKEKLKVLARDIYDAAQIDYAERVAVK